MEEYYRIFEAAISIDYMENFNTTTHMELNRSYADRDNDDGTKRFQAMCIITPAESEQYSGIWNNLKNSTLMGIGNYPKTTTAAYNVLCL